MKTLVAPPLWLPLMLYTSVMLGCSGDDPAGSNMKSSTQAMRPDAGPPTTASERAPAVREDAGGAAPLHRAIIKNNVREFSRLLKQGANPNQELGASARAGKNESIMLLAVRCKDPAFLIAALEAGGDPNTPSSGNGESILFDVVMLGLGDRLPALVAAGADLNRQNMNGDTPIFVAVSINNFDLAYQLMLAGADLTIKNKWGKNVLDRIETYGDRAMAADSRYMKYYLMLVADLRKKGFLSDLPAAMFDGNPNTVAPTNAKPTR